MHTSKAATPVVPGIAFTALFVAGWVLSVAGWPEEFPPTAAELVAYYEDHQGTAMAGAMLTALSAGALVWFVAAIRRRFRDAAGDGHLTDVATGGGWLAAAVLLVSASAKFMPAARADEEGTIDAAVATVMGDLHAHLGGSAVPLAFGVLVAAAAAIGFRHALLPRWLSWVSAVLAAALIVPLVPWVAIMLVPFWTLALTFVLRRGSSVGAAAPRPAVDPAQIGV